MSKLNESFESFVGEVINSTINLDLVAETSAKNDSKINNEFDDSAINNAVLQYL